MTPEQLAADELDRLTAENTRLREELETAGTYTASHEALDDWARERVAKAEAEITRLRSVNAGLVAALRWFIDDIDGTHTVMVEFDANVVRSRIAILAAEEPQP